MTDFRCCSYAGAPLLVHRDGKTYKIGTVCIIDQAKEHGGGGARENFSDEDRFMLKNLATQIVQSMELRLTEMRQGETFAGEFGNDHRLVRRAI